MAESEGEVVLDESTEVEEVEVVLAGEEDAPSKDGVPKGFKKRINKLNAKIAAGSEETERLRQENELLRLASQPSVKRPRLDDFDGDDARYHDALDQFEDAREQRQRDSLVAEVRKLVPAAKEDISQLEAHYDRAEKLKVPDYEAAEDIVLEALGKDVVIGIAQDVPDSEQLIYALSRDINRDKLQELSELFKVNPTRGTLRLGKLQGQMTLQPKKKTTSEAESEVSGDVGPAGAAAYKAKIKKLRESGEKGATKAVIAIKKEARGKGVILE